MSRSARAILFGSAALLGYGLVLLAHGFLPGYLSDEPQTYMAEGAIRCLHDMGLEVFVSHCQAFAQPVGYPLLTGGPMLGLGALLMHLPGVDSYAAYTASRALFDAVALVGGYGLMRRLGAPPAVSLGTAVLYLLTPSVIGIQQYAGTGLGFALLPAYAFADMLAIEAVSGSDKRRRWIVLALYGVVRSSALFMDGYSFVASALIGGFLWLEWGLRSETRHPARLLGGAAFVGVNLVAVGAYLLYVPATYDVSSVDNFRSLGLDAVTLVSPTERIWFADELGLADNHLDLWGDGSNVIWNYTGFACLLLAGIYLARRSRRRQAVALAAAGLIAMALSLGPSLKLDEQVPEFGRGAATERYFMPEGSATVDFPWADAFTVTPGVETMRSTYRWFGVTRLALVVLAGLAVATLIAGGSRSRVLAALLAAIAVAELAPNLPRIAAEHRDAYQALEEVGDEVEGELSRLTAEGEYAFFLTDDAVHNDYMVNLLAADAGLRAYNAGGDKNVAISREAWPPEVEAIAVHGVRAEAIVAALRSNTVDVVIAPYFHPRLTANSWPPPQGVEDRLRSAFSPLYGDSRLRVERGRWLATLRLARSERPSSG